MKITFHPQSDGTVDCILDGLGQYTGCALWVDPTRGKCGPGANHFPLQAVSIAFKYIPPENPPGYEPPPGQTTMLFVHCSGEIIGRVIIPDHKGAYKIISADEVEEVSPPPTAVDAGAAGTPTENGGGEMAKGRGKGVLTGKPVEVKWFKDGVDPDGDAFASSPSLVPADHATEDAAAEIAKQFAAAERDNTPPDGIVFKDPKGPALIGMSGAISAPPRRGAAGWGIAAVLAGIIALAWGLHGYFAPEKAPAHAARAEAHQEATVEAMPEPPPPAPVPEPAMSGMHAPVSTEPQAAATLPILAAQAPSESAPSTVDLAVAVQEQSPDPDERLAARLWKMEELNRTLELKLAGAEDAQDAALISIRQEFAAQIAGLREEIADAYRTRPAAPAIVAPEVPAPLSRIHEHGRDEETDRRARRTLELLPVRAKLAQVWDTLRPRLVRPHHEKKDAARASAAVVTPPKINLEKMNAAYGRSLLAGAKAYRKYLATLSAKPARSVRPTKEECTARWQGFYGSGKPLAIWCEFSPIAREAVAGRP